MALALIFSMFVLIGDADQNGPITADYTAAQTD